MRGHALRNHRGLDCRYAQEHVTARANEQRRDATVEGNVLLFVCTTNLLACLDNLLLVVTVRDALDSRQSLPAVPLLNADVD